MGKYGVILVIPPVLGLHVIFRDNFHQWYNIGIFHINSQLSL
jgi:hypothetical protein